MGTQAALDASDEPRLVRQPADAAIRVTCELQSWLHAPVWHWRGAGRGAGAPVLQPLPGDRPWWRADTRGTYACGFGLPGLLAKVATAQDVGKVTVDGSTDSHSDSPCCGHSCIAETTEALCAVDAAVSQACQCKK